MLLPFRLFYLFGSLAILRDVTPDSLTGTDDFCGFVHRDEIRLQKSAMNQYVYSARLEIKKQARQLHRDRIISMAESYNLLSWPVIESAAILGQESHWRLVMDPAGISITARALEFPDALFNKIGNAYFDRHPKCSRTPF